MATPKVISSAEINLGGFVMHVHMLDNGQRVIDAADFEAFFSQPFVPTDEQMAELAKALRS